MDSESHHSRLAMSSEIDFDPAYLFFSLNNILLIITFLLHVLIGQRGLQGGTSP